MNKLTLEKIATSLLKACKDEGVMYKEAAKIFNTEPAYFKMLEREDKREAIPEKVMDRFHAWVYSGKKLKEYKMPDAVFPLEDIADALNKVGASIIEPSEEPQIKVRPEALTKRKKELAIRSTSKLNDVLKGKMRQMVEKQEADIKAGKKPKRKYTRKPKENPPEVTEKILADAPVPADKHYAEAAPDVINNLKNENHSLRQLLLDATRVNEGLISQVSFLEALKKTHSDAMYNDGYTIMRLKKKIKKLKRRYRL